jgi:hypothetical protein
MKASAVGAQHELNGKDRGVEEAPGYRGGVRPGGARET